MISSADFSLDLEGFHNWKVRIFSLGTWNPEAFMQHILCAAEFEGTVRCTYGSHSAGKCAEVRYKSK